MTLSIAQMARYAAVAAMHCADMAHACSL